MNSTILAEVPIFSGLKQSDLDQLAQCSTRSWFKRGSVIVTEGDPADGFMSWSVDESRFFWVTMMEKKWF